MRAAIFSDIHGNTIALDAALQDIRARGGVDAYWVIGDLAALGPDPVGVLERVYALPNVILTRGNTDRYITHQQPPMPHADELTQDPTRVARYEQLRRNFEWTKGALALTDGLNKLAALPLEHRVILENGVRVLCVHAAPSTDDGDGIHPRQKQAELRELIRDCGADLVFVGHTHYPMDVLVDALRVVNLGSISNPLAPDLRAKYTLLQSDTRGYHLEHCRVEYDRAAVIEQLTRVQHPAREYIARYLRGEQKPSWSKNLSAAEAAQLGLPMEWVDE